MHVLMGLLGGMGMPELLVILAVVLLLFGSAKIPQLMRGFGSGIHEFKKGMKDGEGGDEKKEESKKDEAVKP